MMTIRLLIFALAAVLAAFGQNETQPLQPLDAAQLTAWKQTHTRAGMTRTIGSGDIDAEYSVVYVPFVAMGVNGPQQYSTNISLLNTSEEPVEVLVEFFDDKGQSLAYPFKGPNGALDAYYSAAAGTIAALSDASPNLHFVREPLKFGWARVTSSVPGALSVVSFLTGMDNSRGGVVVHSAVEASFDAFDLRVENNSAQKITMIGLVNPTDEPVTALLSVRESDGESACEVEVTLEPGAQVWRATRHLIGCIRHNTRNYTLRVESLDGDIAVSAYYEYGSLNYATAPITRIESITDTWEEEGEGSGGLLNQPKARVKPRRPAQR